MIAEELVKIRARARGIETSPAEKITGAEKQIDKLNQKMQSTSSIQEKLALGRQMQSEQKKLEAAKKLERQSDGVKKERISREKEI